jgi:hypothetical protein
MYVLFRNDGNKPPIQRKAQTTVQIHFIHNGNLCVPIVNHYSYENQKSIPMQISPIVLTLASTSDLRQNTKRSNVHQCTKINDKLIWRENRLKKGLSLTQS